MDKTQSMPRKPSIGEMPLSVDHIMRFMGELYYKTKMYEEALSNQSTQIEELTKQLNEMKKQLDKTQDFKKEKTDVPS